jgi:hypothetical protein
MDWVSRCCTRPERLAKLVLADGWVFLTANPAWSPAEREAAGAIVTPESAMAALTRPRDEATIRASLSYTVTDATAPDGLERIVSCNLQMPQQRCSTTTTGGSWSSAGAPASCRGVRSATRAWKNLRGARGGASCSARSGGRRGPRRRRPARFRPLRDTAGARLSRRLSCVSPDKP